MNSDKKNVYLEQVLQKQQAVDQALHQKVASAPGAPPPFQDEEQGELSSQAVNYRITGLGPWQTVVVPPNVYTIHTRRGQDTPLNIGLGISFRYRPYTDAFLIIPAAMQTLLINANCICRERQGILVQAYVQWIIDDIHTAYRKLDFSNPDDPMHIVNIQLREQAEAAIKDKVATMSIDEVLSDKQPIIEELTLRLRMVAEGSREDEKTSGLGLKIVTVQIKEAVVSSTRLWENLQAPFRAEREKLARLAELQSQQEIADHELENRESRETEELAVEGRLAERRADEERARYDRQQAEKVRHHQLEQEAERRAITEQSETEKARNEMQLELDLLAVEQEKQRLAAQMDKVKQQMELDEVQAQAKKAEVSADLEVQDLQHQTHIAHTEQDLKLRKIQRDIDNTLSEQHVQAQLIAKLPDIAEKLPTPQEQRTTIITSDGTSEALNPLLRFLTSALSIANGIFNPEKPPQQTAE